MTSPDLPAAAPTASANQTDEPPPLDGWPSGLAALRAQLDEVDDEMHDLLMRRALVIERVANSGKRGAYRPGREASMIRRLLSRHTGPLPKQALVRIWRELLAGTTAMQGPFSVAVCQTDAAVGFIQVAREHFGALTPMHVHRSPAQAIAEVSADTASVAVLPLPSESEPPRDAWWTALLHRDAPRIHVVARLPFWAPRPEGDAGVQALVVAPNPPDPSGQDRTLIGLELDLEASRDRLNAAVTAAGLTPGTVVLRRDQGASVAYAVVDVDGYLEDGDARLAGLDAVLRPPVVLGAYAIPTNGGDA
jgi:chorismate mutase